MENRKPFKLREVLILYNGGQVMLSLYMLYEVSQIKYMQPNLHTSIYIIYLCCFLVNINAGDFETLINA